VRIEHALRRRVAAADAKAATGCLFILTEEELQADAQLAQIPDLPLRYIVSSDTRLVEAGKAEAKDEGDLLYCRNEGEFLVSYQTEGGWFAITKDVLTEVMGAGRDARIAPMPRSAAEALRLMCPNLLGME
jgi:hypothetical protein